MGSYYTCRYHIFEVLRQIEERRMDAPTTTEIAHLLDVPQRKINKRVNGLVLENSINVERITYKTSNNKKRVFKLSAKTKKFYSDYCLITYLDAKNPYLVKHKKLAKRLNLIFRDWIDVF